MGFEFSKDDREIPLHTFDVDGNYVGVINTPIPANMGPPGRTVYGDLVTEDNPVWNFNYSRVEYADDEGAIWFLDDGGDKISVSTGSKLASKPVATDGHVVRFVDGNYEQIEDHREETYYSTLDGNQLIVKELGPVPDNYTDVRRPTVYHEYEGGEWVHRPELEEPFKIDEMRKWRDRELTRVLNEIEKYNIDKDVPEAYKSSKVVSSEQLATLYIVRKDLQDFPEKEGFPFCEPVEMPEWL